MLVGIVAIATVITAIMSAGVVSDADDFLDGLISQDEFEDAIGPLTAVQTLVSAITFATAIVTVIWMYRIASNLRTAGRDTTWSPLFAVFGWILPPILFVIPFLMLRELWKASDPAASDGQWRSSGESTPLWAWFALFGVLPLIVTINQLDTLASRGLPTGDMTSVAETISDSATTGILTAVLNVLAAIAWIVVVRQMTARHTAFTGETV